MRRRWSKVGWVWIVLVSWLAQQAAARPLDLTDPSPRWIEVHFEVSPADEPGSLDQEWSAPRPGYLEPDPGSSPVALRIRIPADQIESHLRSIGTDAIVGSFSEFVWTLDPETGHVLEAAMTGRVRERLRFGPIRASAQVEIRVEMTTSARAGFEPGHGIMGVNTNRFCAPDHSRAHCVGVDPVRFDPTRGYVNAVGSVSARTPLAEIRAFSPLGEVKFLERAAPETETVVSGTSQAKALCSEAFDDPCGVNLGGES